MTKKDVIVIDDANYLITNEFMEKSSIRGYDKYNEIAMVLRTLKVVKQFT